MKDKQRGVSLLMALTLVVVITSIITGASLITHYAIHRSAILTHGAQASAYTEGAIKLAEHLLIVDSFMGNSDSKDEEWVQRWPAYSVEGGEVKGRIDELSSRFNLSMLEVTNPFEEAVFRRLWQMLGGSISEADTIIQNVRSKEYVSVIGVLAAAGIDEKKLHKRALYFSYLPMNAEKININFVSPIVFSAYFKMPVEQAKTILNALEKTPITSNQDLQLFAKRNAIEHIKMDSLEKNSSTVIELRFGIRSRYFQVVGVANIGDTYAVKVVNVDRSRDRIKRMSQRLSKLAGE